MWRVQGGKLKGIGRAKGGIREKGEGEKRLSNQGHFMPEYKCLSAR